MSGKKPSNDQGSDNPKKDKDTGPVVVHDDEGPSVTPEPEVTTPTSGTEDGNGGGEGSTTPPVTPTTPTTPDVSPGDVPSEPDSGGSSARIEALAAALAAVQFPMVITTRYGSVRVLSIEIKDNGVGTVPWVKVEIEGNGETHFRIFNPPTLVEDPAGDIEANGTRYRLDPIVAVVESVALHGGKQ